MPNIDKLYDIPIKTRKKKCRSDQGTAADTTQKAPGLLPQRLADTGAKIIGTVHDEIILEVPEEMAGEAAVFSRRP
jgi:hypothetical protein